MAAVKSIIKPDFSGVKIYNLATGGGASVLDVVKAFEQVLIWSQKPFNLVTRKH